MWTNSASTMGGEVPAYAFQIFNGGNFSGKIQTTWKMKK